jgi:glycosyltransferase involved in cell wall biosynthesis
MNSSQGPMLSIIVPVFNSSRHLSNCLDSILSQTFRSFECILVDDGSTDNSLDICKKYSNLDNRIKVLHQNNAGVSDARNAGLNICAGEYIAFVDSDDTILPEMYEVMFDGQMRYNSDVVCCGYLYKRKSYSIPEFFYTENQAKGAFELDKGDLFGLVWNKIYKKELLDRNKIFFMPGQWFGEDFLFNLKYFSVINSVFNIPNILYIHDEGSSASLSKIRPSFEQSYSRFKSVSKEMVKLKNSGDYINFLIALDFTFTIFLIRNLYTPFLSTYSKRRKTISEIKHFYRKNNAKKTFRGKKYLVFYKFLTAAPFFVLDRTFLLTFSIFFKIRGYS